MTDAPTPTPDVPAIEATGVRYRYPTARPGRGRRSGGRAAGSSGRGDSARRTHAVDGVDLRVAPGEAVALLGPNGSGKSTLMSILAGLRSPGAGRVAVRGGRARLGVVFQSVALDPFVTVHENLRDAGRLAGLPAAEAASRARDRLDAAGLGELAAVRAGRLSGGQQRRVDLVRALLADPAVLLLDEPTTGLDPAARHRFLETLAAERAARRPAMLLSTHLVDEAEPMDRVVLMDRGRIVADGPPAQLRAGLGARRLTVPDAGFDPAPWPGPWQRGAGGWWRPLDAGAEDDSSANDVELVGRLVAAGVPVHVAPPTLADAFEARTGRVLAGAGSEADAAGGAGGTGETAPALAGGMPVRGLGPSDERTARPPSPASEPAP